MNEMKEIIKAFISSTFRDMQAERDHLTMVVFPELRERLERLGLRFSEVDLRWGVPEKGFDGEKANSWSYCKKVIDRVEPFFICMLGQRYGWVPPKNQFDNPIDLENYAGMSITEMEIHHAVLSGNCKKRSYFYLRKTVLPKNLPNEIYCDFVDTSYQQRLKILKDQIYSSGYPVREYDCRWTGQGFDQLNDFGRLVLEDLWSGVLRDKRYISKETWQKVLGHNPENDPIYTNNTNNIPEDLWEKLVDHSKPKTFKPKTIEAQQMEEFAASRLQWFRGRTSELKELNNFINTDLSVDSSGLCVIRSDSGQGKTSLLAKLSEMLSNSNHLLITHFVGATEKSDDLRSLLEWIIKELSRKGISGKSEKGRLSSMEDLRKYLADILKNYSGNRLIVLIIDAINLLYGIYDTDWIPKKISKNIRILISCTEYPSNMPDNRATQILKNLNNREPKPRWLNLRPLHENDVRQIIIDFFNEYCKELDQQNIDMLCQMEQTRNPLYLMVMLNELRTLGGIKLNVKVPGLITNMKKQYPDIISLFTWVLKRIEFFGSHVVKSWFAYMAISRTGMSINELNDLLMRKYGEEQSGTAYLIERAVRHFLRHRGSYLDFFHEQLKFAVENYCLQKDQRKYHKDIANYFRDKWRKPNKHAISELPYHQMKASLWDSLYEVLRDIDYQNYKIKYYGYHHLMQDATQTIRAVCELAELHNSELIIRFSLLYDKYRDFLPGPCEMILQFAQEGDYSICSQVIKQEEDKWLRFNMSLIAAWQSMINNNLERKRFFIMNAIRSVSGGINSYNQGAVFEAINALYKGGMEDVVDLLSNNFLMEQFITNQKKILVQSQSRDVRKRLEEKIKHCATNKYELRKLLSLLASIYFGANEEDKAITLLKRSLQVAESIEDPYYRAGNLADILKNNPLLSMQSLSKEIKSSIKNLQVIEWRLCCLCQMALTIIKNNGHLSCLEVVEMVDTIIKPTFSNWESTVEKERPQYPGKKKGLLSGKDAINFIFHTFYDRKLLPKILSELSIELLKQQDVIVKDAGEWLIEAALFASTKEVNSPGFQDEFRIEFAEKLLAEEIINYARPLLIRTQDRLQDIRNKQSEKNYIQYIFRLINGFRKTGDMNREDVLNEHIYQIARRPWSDLDILLSFAEGFAGINDTGKAREFFQIAISRAQNYDTPENCYPLSRTSKSLRNSFTAGKMPDLYKALRKELNRTFHDVANISGYDSFLKHLATAFHYSGDKAGCLDVLLMAFKKMKTKRVSDYLFKELIKTIDQFDSPKYGPHLYAAVADTVSYCSSQLKDDRAHTSVFDALKHLSFIADTMDDVDEVNYNAKIYTILAARLLDTFDYQKIEEFLSRLVEIIEKTGSSVDRFYYFSNLARFAAIPKYNAYAKFYSAYAAFAFDVSVKLAPMSGGPGRYKILISYLHESIDKNPIFYLEAIGIYKKMFSRLSKQRESWTAEVFSILAVDFKNLLRCIKGHQSPILKRLFYPSYLRLLQFRASVKSLRRTYLAKEYDKRYEILISIAPNLYRAFNKRLICFLLRLVEGYFKRKSKSRDKYKILGEIGDKWKEIGKFDRFKKLSYFVYYELEQNMVLLPPKYFAELTLQQDLLDTSGKLFNEFLKTMEKNKISEFNDQIYQLFDHLIEMITDSDYRKNFKRNAVKILEKLPSIILEQKYRQPLETKLICKMALLDSTEALKLMQNIDPKQSQLSIIPELAETLSKLEIDRKKWKLLLILLLDSLEDKKSLYNVLSSLIRVAKISEIPTIAEHVLSTTDKS